MRKWLIPFLSGALFAAGCSGASEGRTVVASFYPLAFAAQRIAGPEWEVIDLTPPGAEAHDVELSAEDRAALERADVLFYLGDIGFQPQVEAAIDDADGEVVAITDRLSLHPGGDPHVWLSPNLYLSAIDLLQVRLWEIDPGDEDGYTARFRRLARALEILEERYERTLSECRFTTLIVPHEAFGWLADHYSLRQFGLAGQIPEAEPGQDRIVEAHRLIEGGQAGAVFFEPGQGSERIARSVAEDAGVPALPLATLESQPPEGDYLTVMEDNLDSLREGLGCR
jgi:zinc transport system substrate-binding protein